MAVEDSESVESQIRRICPNGAIGYRVQVYEPTPETYPIKSRHGRDMYSIDPEAIEYPVGTPPGDHQVIFLDNSSKAIKVYKNPVITVEALKKKQAAATPNKKESKAAESEDTDEADDFENDIKTASGGADSDQSSDFAKRIQDLHIQRKRIRIAKETRHTAEMAEMIAHATACQDETLRKFGQIDATQANHTMAQMAISKALADAYVKIAQPPPPPAPPIDWNGLLKTGLEGVNTIITTYGGKRHEHDRALFVKEVAEAVKGSLSTSSSIDTIGEGADKPTERVTQATTKKTTERATEKPADKNDKNDPDPPPVTEQSPAPRVEKKKGSGNSFLIAWRSMCRVMCGLTDLDIVNMVAQPALLVAVLAGVGSMAPQMPKLDRQSSIYLPVGTRT